MDGSVESKKSWNKYYINTEMVDSHIEKKDTYLPSLVSFISLAYYRAYVDIKQSHSDTYAQLERVLAKT